MRQHRPMKYQAFAGRNNCWNLEKAYNGQAIMQETRHRVLLAPVQLGLGVDSSHLLHHVSTTKNYVVNTMKFRSLINTAFARRTNNTWFDGIAVDRALARTLPRVLHLDAGFVDAPAVARASVTLQRSELAVVRALRHERAHQTRTT